MHSWRGVTTFSLVMLALAAALGLFSMVAMAAPVELNWMAPTENTDGTPLTDLDGFNIHFGQAAGGPYQVTVRIDEETQTTLTVPDLSEGTWYFVVTAFNDAGEESDHSNEVSKVILAPVPMPPGMLTVVNLLVWDIVKQSGRYVFLGVGTVPNGTPCDPTQTVNGRYAVATSAVTWFGNVRPPVVVADCS